MISKIYKLRKIGPQEAIENFSMAYQHTAPSKWSDFQLKHVAHLIKWATVGFATREHVKLSKSLLIRELGQRGYIKHIHMVYPVVQGHSLGEGKITTYEYRPLLKKLIKWVQAQGIAAFLEFKTLMKTVIDDIEVTFKKKMSWFWKMASFWFSSYADIKKAERIKKEAAVTTIQDTYITNKREVQISSAESHAIGNLNLRTHKHDQLLENLMNKVKERLNQERFVADLRDDLVAAK